MTLSQQVFASPEECACQGGRWWGSQAKSMYGMLRLYMRGHDERTTQLRTFVARRGDCDFSVVDAPATFITSLTPLSPAFFLLFECINLSLSPVVSSLNSVLCPCSLLVSWHHLHGHRCRRRHHTITAHDNNSTSPSPSSSTTTVERTRQLPRRGLRRSTTHLAGLPRGPWPIRRPAADAWGRHVRPTPSQNPAVFRVTALIRRPVHNYVLAHSKPLAGNNSTRRFPKNGTARKHRRTRIQVSFCKWLWFPSSSSSTPTLT